MKNKISFLLGLSLLLLASTAHAQEPQTWVSGVGDDVNPCSRTAPCKTFIGAISKTAAGGEILVLDPGSFGPVTIRHSITINGNSTHAGIIQQASDVDAVIVNAGPDDVVILRGLSINGAGAARHGIRYRAGGMLLIEHCSIDGFTQNDIDVSLAASGNLVVKDTSLTGGTTGIHLNITTGTLAAAVDHTTFQGATNGIVSLEGSAEVTNSLFVGNTGFGVRSRGGTISVTNSLLTNNSVAIQAQAGTVRLSNNEIFDNGTGIACGGGTVASTGNNKKAGNSGGVAPACVPTTTITEY